MNEEWECPPNWPQTTPDLQHPRPRVGGVAHAALGTVPTGAWTSDLGMESTQQRGVSRHGGSSGCDQPPPVWLRELRMVNNREIDQQKWLVNG